MADPPRLCLLRGGGDLATGVAWRLTRAGLAVVVTELANPLTVRRTVALSTAVRDGVVDIEGMIGRRATSVADAVDIARSGEVGVVVCAELPTLDVAAVIDARLAKRNIDTTIDDAACVVGLGPGFTAGVDCHAVVETLRGPHLGRVLWEGSAAPNTGWPGSIGGQDADRVLRAPASGTVVWSTAIGELVDLGELLGTVEGQEVRATCPGVVRGLIDPATVVREGLKIGDVDPRVGVSCLEISDKALAIGGGVVEAVLVCTSRSR